jgi:hypothetical protein
MIDNLTTILTSQAKPTLLLVALASLTAIIVIYAVFVFYFYRFLAKKNIIELNLNQYNQYSNPILIKVFATLFYIIEYLILLPILTFFWFAILAVLTLILAKGLTINMVLLLSAALVAAVRITAYITEDLAKDLAKMLPFTLLAIAITTAEFFDIPAFLDRAYEIPNLLSSIPYYLLFIVAVELVLRIFDFLQEVLQPEETTEKQGSY